MSTSKTTARHLEETADGAAHPDADQQLRVERTRRAVSLGWDMAALVDGVPSPSLGAASGADLDATLVADWTSEARLVVRSIERSIAALDLALTTPEGQPPLGGVESVLDTPGSRRFQLRRAAFALHVQLVEALSVAKLAKAYGIGRALSSLARLEDGTAGSEAARQLLAERNVVRLADWVDDLSSLFPLHAAYGVAEGLENWRAYIAQAHEESAALVSGTLRDQSELWRALVSGELAPEALLSPRDYVRASLGLAARLRRLLLGIVVRWSVVLVALAAVVAGAAAGVQRASALGEADKFAFDVCAGVIALGLFVFTVASAAKRSVAHAEPALWSAEIDDRVARAATRLPERGHTRRDESDEEYAFLGFFGDRPSAPDRSEPQGARLFVPTTSAAAGEARLAGQPSAPPVTAPIRIPSEEPLEDIPPPLVAPTKHRHRRRLVALVVFLVVVIGGGLAARAYAFSSFSVTSGSMTPTLDTGDRVFVDKLPFVRDSIQRGDIVVFRRVAADTVDVSTPYVVKRVIGLPGERISSEFDTIYVNGQPLTEPWLPALTTACAESAYDIPNQVVPADHYFVLGDCRGNSDDSRIWGTVPASSVVGKVFLVYWRNSHPWWEWF